MTRLIALTLAFLLAACETTPEILPAPVDPCPSSAAAALEKPVEKPGLTPEQRQALDVAIIATLGPALGVAVIGYWDVQEPARTGRLEARIEATRRWCQSGTP